jgi:hypothetical protein
MINLKTTPNAQLCYYYIPIKKNYLETNWGPPVNFLDSLEPPN